VLAVCRMQGEEQCVRYLHRDSPRWTCKSNYFVTIIWCHVVCVKLMTVATFEVWSRINIAVICATLNTPSGLVKNSFRAATRSPKHKFDFFFYIKYLFKIIYMYIFMKKLYMYIFMKMTKKSIDIILTFLNSTTSNYSLFTFPMFDPNLTLNDFFYQTKGSTNGYLRSKIRFTTSL
jgi:hypothetical protein